MAFPSNKNVTRDVDGNIGVPDPTLPQHAANKAYVDAHAGSGGGGGGTAAKWLSGTGVPGAGTGVPGDWYFDIATDRVYEKTGPTVWTFRSDLTGSPGPQGPQGPPGTGGSGGSGTAVVVQPGPPTDLDAVWVDSDEPGGGATVVVPHTHDVADIVSGRFPNARMPSLEQIPAGASLNSYGLPGIFVQGTGANATEALGYPVEGLAGFLEVFTNSASSQVWQRFTTRTAPVRTFTRYASATVVWTEFAPAPTGWTNITLDSGVTNTTAGGTFPIFAYRLENNGTQLHIRGTRLTIAPITITAPADYAIATGANALPVAARPVVASLRYKTITMYPAGNNAPVIARLTLVADGSLTWRTSVSGTSNLIEFDDVFWQL